MFTSFLKSSRNIIDQDLALQIQKLLRRPHDTRVSVRPSSILGAGSGVYATHSFDPGHVACLYPGVYTPPLPPAVLPIEEYRHTYLAGQRTPSGVLAEQNAYILNLKDVGGYLDGLALMNSASTKDKPKNNTTTSPPQHENPSACGHLVNHSHASKVNVRVVSFFWKDVFRLVAFDGDDDYYAVPNQVRMDGSPWYYCPMEENIVWFQQGLDANSSERACGAAMVAFKPIATGDELYLDYGLVQPYPDWAKEWYTTN